MLVVGNRRIPGAFIQQLKNGRWHVMQRVAGKNRYPIDVVKIPMAVPLTTAFKQNIERTAAMTTGATMMRACGVQPI